MGVFDVFNKAKSVIQRENVLYYPGCVTAQKLPKIFTNYKSLLSDVGLDFKILPELKCCGAPLLSAGYEGEFDSIRKENLEILQKNGITKIITNCPHCQDILKKLYGLKVQHITEVLDSRKHKLNAKNAEEVSYHDPCILARKNDIIKEPREVLRSSGYRIHEPRLCKKNTMCCGAGGGLKQSNPQMADKIAKNRLKQFMTQKIIVSCPYCYIHLKDAAEHKSHKHILELSETIFEE